MPEGTDSQDQGEQKPVKEIEESIIIENLHLLSIQLIGEKNEELDEVTKENLLAIKMRESRIEGDKITRSIVIEYDTDSGRIKLADRVFQFGERSRLHTDLVTYGKQIEFDKDKGRWITKNPGTNTILLYQPGDMPSVEQYTAAVAGKETLLPDDRRILPERIIPEHPELIGVREQWGQSEFTNDASGDLVVLKTIQQFNKQFGPPR